MKNYIVKLKLKGQMTQVPDSQKLFGALMYLLAEKKSGEAEATAFTKAVFGKEFHFALSNVMPEGYLPTPQEYLVDALSEKKVPNMKEVRAAIKLRGYIKIEDLGKVFKEPEACANIFPYVEQMDFQQLRSSVDSIRYQIPGLDTRLYSVPTVVLSEITKDRDGAERQKPVDTYSFYLQTDESDLCSGLLNALRGAEDEKKLFILGKRASQGLNVFQIEEMKKLEDHDIPDGKDGMFLNTGMLLPENIDFLNSTIKLFTSERRPFEMIGGWDADMQKYFISFIAPGSILQVPKGPKFAGKSVVSKFFARDIVFGNAFLYPVILPKKEE